ncbi:RNA polymerase sigma factor [Kribbella sp. C-35]|uniref:RNA polymerase sigma factor n=1 Tax=Kribbella sp. C-35 TaxID=2789276 RepID=UPI00397E7C8D
MDDRPGQAVASDRELWERLREADEYPLSDLFHRHSDAVYNFAFRRTGSWSIAEDVVQATFTMLWRRATDHRIDALTLETARPLLLSIARLECNHATRSVRRLRALRDRLQLNRTDSVPDHSAETAAERHRPEGRARDQDQERLARRRGVDDRDGRTQRRRQRRTAG